MLKEIELKHYMVANPVTVAAGASLFEAMHLILANKISGLCVVDSGGKLIGILSELDCLRGVLSSVYNDSGIGLVSDVMTTENIKSAGIHDSIADVATDMLQDSKRRRPVLDSEGHLIGQITIRQLLRAVKEFNCSPDPTEAD
ncbi:MAG: CBS domain-containing protein [Luminiphilus sp.]|nr:CBS domain-containing protein [Luminiphilus sp.]